MFNIYINFYYIIDKIYIETQTLYFITKIILFTVFKSQIKYFMRISFFLVHSQICEDFQITFWKMI